MNVDKSSRATTAAAATTPNRSFVHSVKVPRLYRLAAGVLKDLEDRKSSLNQLAHNCKHPNKKGIVGLVSKLIEHREWLDLMLNETKLFEKEPRLNPYLAKVLIVERFWGSGRLNGDAKPIQVVREYEPRLRTCFESLTKSGRAINQTDRLTINLPRYVRINTLKITVDKAIEGFRNEGWQFCRLEDLSIGNYRDFVTVIDRLAAKQFVQDIHVPEVLVFAANTNFGEHRWYANGTILLQDKSTCLSAVVLGAAVGASVLDMCAAPGMKTTHVAARLANDGRVFAIEQDAKRCETLRETVEFCGASCVRVLERDALLVDGGGDGENGIAECEYVLVDPSCSGSGIYRRRELDRERSFESKRLFRLAEFQKKLLVHAMRTVRAARYIVYSTCSVFHEENERVVQTALHMMPEFKLIAIDRRLQRRFGLMPFRDRMSDEADDKPPLNDDLMRIRRKCLNLNYETDRTNGFFIALFKRRRQQPDDNEDEDAAAVDSAPE